MIIAFTGYKGSGKSLACSMLKHLGYLELNFADPVKYMAVELCPEIPLEHCYILEEKERPRDIEITNNALLRQAQKYGYNSLPSGLQDTSIFKFKSLRNFLQFLGTEFGRALESTFWIKVFRSKLDPHRNYACGDLRFSNEADTIRDLGGLVVMISRLGLISTDTHASEKLDFDTDFTIVNNDIESFRNDVLHTEELIKYGQKSR